MNKQTVLIFIAVNAVILGFAIKRIFGRFYVFQKALKDHFYPWDIMHNDRLNNWASKKDARHKVNVLYAVILSLAAVNWIVYQLLF